MVLSGKHHNKIIKHMKKKPTLARLFVLIHSRYRHLEKDARALRNDFLSATKERRTATCAYIRRKIKNMEENHRELETDLKTFLDDETDFYLNKVC